MDTALADPVTLIGLATIVLAAAAGVAVLLLSRPADRSAATGTASDNGWAMGHDERAARERRSARVRGLLDMAESHLGLYRALEASLASGDAAQMASVLEQARLAEQVADDLSYLTVSDEAFVRAARRYVDLDQAYAREATALITAGEVGSVPIRLSERMPVLAQAADELRQAADRYVNRPSDSTIDRSIA